MAELIVISVPHGDESSHVIFFHGLGGDPQKTWQSSIDPHICWPQWLAEDIKGLAVWSIGYDAAVSRWRGSAMNLPDRAKNVLERILLEPKLRTGEIILIGHSLGGLVIKQLLRTAENLAHQRNDASDFIKRVHRVAFLATPHQGADLATLGDQLRIIVLPSAATACLVRNDPNLRDLNSWYRVWSRSRDITHIILTETRSTKKFFLVVKPDSSDPGLEVDPIPIDADHISICKLKDRSSEIYLHIRSFIERKLESPHLDNLSKDVQKIHESLARLNNKFDIFHMASPIRKYPKELIDNEINKNLLSIKQARFFGGYSVTEPSIRLAEKIISGEFEVGSDDIKSSTLAWCARLLAVENGVKADELLILARKLGDGQEIAIAEAFRISANGDLDGALSKLANLTSPEARSATFIIITGGKDSASAIKWLSKAGILFSDLDGDGKFITLIMLFELGRWKTALDYASELQEEDYQNAPVLFHIAALAYLVQAIPDELKSFVLQHPPFEAKTFPLASNTESIQARRQAQNLFYKSADAARELGCVMAANIAEDYALWLELRDPESSDSGREKLKVSMRDPSHSLRRLHFALQFGIKLDTDAVEQEIERQSALSGESTADIALARFSLAFTLKSPKDIADYIERHRGELQGHIPKKSIDIVQIEMLAKAGLPRQAEECLNHIVGELSEAEQNRLRRINAEFTGTDPIEARKTQFENSGQLNDLSNLVSLLEEQNDWPRVCHFGSLLFNKTFALSDAERLAKALNATRQFDELAELLRKYPEFLDQSDDLQLFWSWSLYREGSLSESSTVLDKLKLKRDHYNDRALKVNLAIASGAWETLLPYVEQEWLKKDERTTDELMQAAHLAQFVGSPRAKKLAYAAVSKAANDANIHMAAYLFATKAGWEDDDTAVQWFQQAVELSGENGPIQKISLKDFFDQKPEWDRRVNEIWQQLNAGNMPVFAAAHVLNMSLVEMFLLPALVNPFEPDVRRRALVHAYSGARQSLQQKDYHTVAIDASALLTLGVLGVLEKTYEVFDHMVIAHSTLNWLFQEKQKISFHQPSRIKEAQKIRGLIATHALNNFDSNEKIDVDLANEVGEELASMLAEVQAGSDSTKRQRIVIRTSPVHRIGSLMEEEVDLTSYYQNLCSCMAIVDKLKQKGQLTATEERRARLYFSLHDKAWPHQPEINDFAILYLDNLSVTHLQHTGLLEKLQPAGLEAYVSKRKIEETNALLQYEQLASKVETIIEDIRRFLAAGIQTGKIKLSKMVEVDESDMTNLAYHPTYEIMGLANDTEAIIIDDRFLNQHSNIEHATILTTLDLLEILKTKDHITLDEMLDCRTKLRRFGYSFVPITKEELEHHLSVSEVIDGRLIETAELKAIRENILRVRMGRFLQLPKEGPWHDNLMRILMQILPTQWLPDIEEATARARSEWLKQILDIRGWLYLLNTRTDQNAVENAYGAQVMLLLLSCLDIPIESNERYWKWIEESILEKIQNENHKLYLVLIEHVKKYIGSIIEPILAKGVE